VGAGFIDFHCHLDLYPDLESAVAECERLGIYTLAVTTTPKAWPRNNELARATRYVRAALGLHPQLVAERASEFALWDRYLPQARFIGEVGLDAGPRFYRSMDQQKHLFERVLAACAKAGGKILTVHSVRAVTAVLDMIEAHLPQERGRVVMHWFTGTASEARRAIDLGCYFSINKEMLGKERHRKLVVGLPLERLLTETDGPFTQRNGTPMLPSDVGATVSELATVLGLQETVLASAIRTNLRALLSDEQGRADFT
jgi:TatD DNase family protein